MALDIDAELKKAKEKTDVYKTYKEYKEGYDELKKKGGNSQEKSNDLLSKPLDNFTNWRTKKTKEGKSFLDELIKTLKSTKGTGLETDKLVKRIFVNSLKKLKPQLKELIIDEVKKTLSCSNIQLYQFNTIYHIPVKSVDLFGNFELSPDDRVGKLFYEVSATTFNQLPYSMNRQLYDRTQNLNQTYISVAGSNYFGSSQQDLFDISYVESYVDLLTNQTVQGSFFKVELKSRQTIPTVDEFLNDYYSTIDILDYKTFFTNLVDYVTGAISFGRGDGKLKLSMIQKTLTIMQRIMGLCSDNTKEIDVGGSSKLSEIDTIDESFYELDEIDLRIIDQRTSDIKLGVVEFEDCDNIKLPINFEAALTSLENLQFFDDTSDVNEIDDALGIIYPVINDDPSFKLSVDQGFFEQFLKALINSILSPKTVLPIMIAGGMVNNPIFKNISNIDDFSKIFKTFFIGILKKITSIFTKEVFNELKKEIKALIKPIILDVKTEKIRKKYQMILSIISILPALTKITKDFTECKSVLDELLQLLNIGVKSALNKKISLGGEIPLPLLLAAKGLDGYSPTRSFLNTVQNLQELGIPTGPMPDGSPNEFLVAIKGIIDGNSKEVVENSKVSIGIGPLTVTPAGITIPKDAYGKFF